MNRKQLMKRNRKKLLTRKRQKNLKVIIMLIRENLVNQVVKPKSLKDQELIRNQNKEDQEKYITSRISLMIWMITYCYDYLYIKFKHKFTEYFCCSPISFLEMY